MKKEWYQTRIRMTPDRVIETLQKENFSIDEREAIRILIFLRKIAKVTVTTYLEKHEHGKGKNS